MTIAIGSILPVGTIIHSMLTVAQFESEYGTNWVIADGRSVTGTLYATITGNTTIPDMRGAFLRSKGATYNPDGDLAVGTYTADKLASHNHREQGFRAPNQIVPLMAGSTGGSLFNHESNVLDASGNQTNTIVPLNTQNTGSNETSPRSITVNVFIRIN